MASPPFLIQTGQAAQIPKLAGILGEQTGHSTNIDIFHYSCVCGSEREKERDAEGRVWRFKWRN